MNFLFDHIILFEIIVNYRIIILYDSECIKMNKRTENQNIKRK